MNIKRHAACFSLLTSLVLTSLIFTSCSDKLKATTIRLIRQEGTIELTGDDGKLRSLTDRLRFNSGDVLRTHTKSLAGLSLDDAKAVLMNEESCAEFHQEKKGKWLEIDLTEGDLFFSVDEKLKDDESFEIHTSTMVIGIRGTSGYVTADAQGRDVLIVTEGTVHVSGINPDTGEVIEEDVSAGHQVTVYLFDRPTNSVKFHLESVAEKDLQPFPIFSITEEEPRLEKVCKATGWDPDLLRRYASELPAEQPWLNGESIIEGPPPEEVDNLRESAPAESESAAERPEESSTTDNRESSSAEESSEANRRETLAGRNPNQTTAAAENTRAASQNTQNSNTQNTTTAAGTGTAAAGQNTANTAAGNTAVSGATTGTDTAAAGNTAENTADGNAVSSGNTLSAGPSGNTDSNADVDFDPNEDEDVTEAASQTEAATQAQTAAGADTGSAGTDTAGSGTTGTDTAGSGTTGSDTADSGTTGSDTAGSGTAGSDTAGSDTSGSDTAAAPEDPGADYYSMFDDTGGSDTASP